MAGGMQERRKVKPKPLPDNWKTYDSMKWNGRKIEKGTELTIEGKRGRYRFVRLVQVEEEVDGQMRVIREWIDTVGGETKTRSAMAHSFYPQKIKTVHRINKTRENSK